MSDEPRKRAPLFGDASEETKNETPNRLDLGRFEPKPRPKPAPNLDVARVDLISEESGFTTKHSKKPTSKPTKTDGRRLKKSPRTSQFNVRLKPETSERFWNGAESMGMEYADGFLEYLLDLHEEKTK